MTAYYEPAPDWDTDPAGRCRPGMVNLTAFLVARYPSASSLGCYNPRAKTGGSTPSLHRDGRAIDIGFGNLDEREAAYEWLIAHADALRLQMVLNYISGDYGGTRWRIPYRSGDNEAGRGTWGSSGHWLHIELLAAGADDTTPTADITGVPAGPPPPPELPEYVPVVDISKWQGDARFDVLADAGVAGVIVRAGNGKHAGPDPRFDEYVTGATAAGLPVGAYYWLRPLDDAGPVDQAEAFLAEVDGADVRFLMADAEWYWDTDEGETPLPAAEMAEWLRRFLHRLDEDGRPVIIYTNADYWRAHVADDDLAGAYPLIIARYPHGDAVAPSDPSDWAAFAHYGNRLPDAIDGAADWAGWQFTSTLPGAALGVSSDGLDGNLIRPEAWAAWTATSSTPAPTPTPAPAPPPTEHTRRLYNVSTALLPRLSVKTADAPVKQVAMVQAILNAKSGAGLTVDGKFGAKTEKAVKAWQAWHRLDADGWVGPNTWRSLLESH